MKKRLSLLGICSLFFIVSVCPLLATEGAMGWPAVSMGKGPIFIADFAIFEDGQELSMVEFYLDIGYSEIQFVKDELGYTGSYEFDIKITDRKDSLIHKLSFLSSILTDRYEETQSTVWTQFKVIQFPLSPGLYLLDATITDSETKDSSNLRRFFLVRAFPKKALSISDIQLSQNIEQARPEHTYLKNNRYVEPNAQRTFAPGLSDLYLYYEVYNLPDNHDPDSDICDTTFSFYNSLGELMFRRQRNIPRPATTCAVSVRFALNKFISGEYIVAVRVVDKASGQSAESSTTFTITDPSTVISAVIQ